MRGSINLGSKVDGVRGGVVPKACVGIYCMGFFGNTLHLYEFLKQVPGIRMHQPLYTWYVY